VSAIAFAGAEKCMTQIPPLRREKKEDHLTFTITRENPPQRGDLLLTMEENLDSLLPIYIYIHKKRLSPATRHR
jgi:hypothetical protein